MTSDRLVLTPEKETLFWTKVQKTESCWLWTAATQNGYGAFWIPRQNRRAHVVSYETLVGRVPDGLMLDHLCRVRHCVNPAHLEPVTCRENLLRGETLAAANKDKTHCPQGHPYSPENTYRNPRGLRTCLHCNRIRLARTCICQQCGITLRKNVLRRHERRMHPDVTGEVS